MTKKGKKKLAIILLVVAAVKISTYFAMSSFLKARFTKLAEKFDKKTTRLDSQIKDLEELEKKAKDLKHKKSEKYLEKNSAKNQLSVPEKGEEFVSLKIKDYGTIKFKLFEDMFPNTVSYFKKCVEEGKYNGFNFYKTIKDLGIRVGEEIKRGEQLEDLEANRFVHAFNGAIFVDSLDNLSFNHPSEFYIVYSNDGKTANFNALEKEKKELFEETSTEKVNFKIYEQDVIKAYKERGGKPEYDLKVSIFGQIFSGLDVVKKIATAQTTKDLKFKKPIVLEKAEINKY